MFPPFSVVSPKESDRKKRMDPLQDMTKFLEVKKSHKKDKDRKHKHKKRKDTQKDSKRKQKKSIEEMRKERLRREQEEHERERKLLASVRGEISKETTTQDNDGYQAYRYVQI